MGSTRLPGKVLLDIMGKPMLWHVVERLKFSKKINDIVLAIPDTKDNDILEDFATNNSIKFFRGSENDVLSRYYQAAKKFGTDIIVRTTSDCPLVDPVIVDRVLKKHLENGADFTANVKEGKKGKVEKRTFPRGLGVGAFNFSILEEANFQAKEDYQREHVDPYIFENLGKWKTESIHNKKDFSHLRLTVDEPKDLELIRQIYKRLYPKKKIFLMKDILSLYKTDPKLFEINKNVGQKTI